MLDGNNDYDKWCKNCHVVSARKRRKRSDYKDYYKAWVAKKLKIIAEYLLTHPCVDCGEKDIRVLQFDHVRGEKLRTIASMLRDHYALELILKEIAKCDIRCANCHQRKTLNNNNSFKGQIMRELLKENLE